VDTNHRNVDSHTLDLHYLRVHDAMKELEDFIKHHQRQAEGHKEYDVDIITGAGRHSQVLDCAHVHKQRLMAAHSGQALPIQGSVCCRPMAGVCVCATVD
jgi:hypothetical protein